MFIRSKSRGGRNCCDICYRRFRLPSRLNHHRSIAHVGVYFRCALAGCEKQYKTRDALAMHQKTVGHSGIQLFDPNPKNVNRKTFKNQKSPQLIQDSSKLYQCEECSKTFIKLWDLCQHRQEEHNDPQVVNSSKSVSGIGQLECGDISHIVQSPEIPEEELQTADNSYS